MFTGLIEHLGTVSSIVKDQNGCTLTVADSAPILADCHIGDSIAVNGACLTVTEFDVSKEGGWFKVWLANETLDRTDLGERGVGDQVNLERAMGAHVRFGGHFVQAHVDTTATIVDRASDGDSLRLTFELPEPTPSRPSLLPYLIPKGYVAVDGASLTLTGVDDDKRTFSVMLITHTQEKITLSKKQVGGKVNIEVDMVGKYVEKSVTVVSRLNASRPTSPALRTNPTNIPRPASPTKHPLSTDTFRPKAKVNSSATVRKPASVVGSSHPRSASSRPNSSSGRDPVQPPRPASPTKVTPRVRNGALSPTIQPKVAGSSSLRSATPELRTRAFTASSDALRPTEEPARARNSSFSLQHSVSHSQLHPSNDAPPRRKPLELSPGSSTNISPPARIKSKVTAVSRQDTSTASPSGSSHLSPRPPTARARAPSISSSSSVRSTPPSQGIYPITAASPAANPHRYATPRPSPSRLNASISHNQYQPFGHINDDSPVQYARINGKAKVDPASIPLPPNSPPSSSLSFSSRSSVSHSSYASESSRSLSSAPTTQRNGSPEGLAATLDNLVSYVGNRVDDSVDSGQDRDTDGENDEERKVRAEAKSNRKIADLEITNRSLLAINASLESTKNRQAKEIRELRRKLRESRLILPPVTFRAVKSSLDHDDTVEESDESSGSEDEVEAEDEAYNRVKTILEGLLETGKQALEAKMEDFPEGGKGVAKVLTADEVRTWRDSRGVASDIDSQSILELDKDDEVDFGGAISQSQQTLVPDQADVGAMVNHSRPSSPLPPILITHSS
ncbi:hypothetical protein BDQ17DRAFT_1404244 [Cyathus striatus]|nr:hypothetical protein BDQ17DRAFT_1404244 [Cyathus striatus]